jgi:hypothetical protein
MPGEDMIVRPEAGVVFRRLREGKGGVLLKLDTGDYHSLNETGAVLWELIAEGSTERDLAREFRGLVEDEPADLEKEIGEFVQQLHGRGLVSIA